MRPPPSLQTPPVTMIWFTLSGLLYLIWGFAAEFVIRPKPVVPATETPGFLLICAGAGCGVALFDRYHPKFGPYACTAVIVAIYFAVMTGKTSILPLMLFIGIVQLMRALLRVTIVAEEKG